MFAAIRDSGERVVIDGNCFSACTLVTAIIPKERICVTERAVFGFHAGWTDRDILDIVHVCAYFNFRVRVVDGLGLRLEDARSRAREGGQ